VRRLLPLLLLVACRDRPVEERRAEVEELCATYCPTRVECVADGFAGGSVRECERKCVADERPLEDSGCGEASLAALQCLAEVACEDLEAAVAGVAGAGETACYAELREQQDRCDSTPIY
jgi:hypothetical protein